MRVVKLEEEVEIPKGLGGEKIIRCPHCEKKIKLVMEIETEEATIQDAEIYTQKHHFTKNFEGCHKLEGPLQRALLGPDKDVIIISLKTAKGKDLRDVFPVYLRFTGELEPSAQRGISVLRRERFASFLRHYKITEETKGYNIPEKMSQWKGKKVKVVNYAGRDQIFIPGHLVRGCKVLARC